MRRQLRVTVGVRSKKTRKAARALIRQGHRVLLTYGIQDDGSCTCGATDCKAGKHPITQFFPNGVKSATTDMTLIDKALEAVPEANLAMALGGLSVVDIDGQIGKEAVEKLGLPKAPRVLTGRGKHIYFAGEHADGTFKGDQVDVLTGPDRYVMMPPSRHISGKNYRWSPLSSETTPPVPSTLAQLRKTPATPTAAKPKTSTNRKAISTGMRNDALFRLSCFLHAKGYQVATVEEVVQTVNERECATPLPDTELDKLLQSGGRYAEPMGDLFERVGDAEVLPLEPLWYPYIMRHGVTLLIGDPGKGKSLLVAEIVAIVTTGGTWPLSDDASEPADVLLLSAEDSFNRVTLARLREAGADTNRVHRMKKFRALDREYLELVKDYVREHGPGLIIIDTLAAYLGSERDMNRQNEIGGFLGELTELAEETGCAILGLAHMNKQSNEHPIYRVVGSIGFMASVRSAIFLGDDPKNRNRLALAHGKANGTVKGPTIAFERVGGGKDQVPTLKAVEFIDADESDVCRVEKRDVGRPPSTSDEAEEFILSTLSDEPVAWSAVSLSASARSICSEPTLISARTKLVEQGLVEQVGKARSAKWRLVHADDEADTEGDFDAENE